MKKLKYAIFDFDGTLVDSQWCWQTMLLRAILERGHALDYDDVEPCLDVEWLSRHEELRAKYGIEEPLFTDYHQFHPYIDRFYCNEVCWKPGALEYLEHLKKQGVVLVIFSTTPEYLLRHALTHLGAEDLFDVIFSGHDRGWSKSDPQSFRRCMTELNASAEECVMFEDSLYSIQSAKAAGMTVYAVKERCFRQNREKIREIADRYAQYLTDFIE